MVAIRSSDLGRTDRERLVKNGFLQPVMKGWYIPSRPDEVAGESTAWYASFRDFCASYLNERFGTNWCLSPEPSLQLHAGNRTVPRQLLVRSPKSDNKITELPHGTSLLTVRYSMPDKRDIETKNGMNLYALLPALIECTPRLFQQNPTDIRAALSIISDASEILARLLEGGHTTIAGRLAGAFRNMGRDRTADDIVATMRAADYDVRESDPFETKQPVIPGCSVCTGAFHVCIYPPLYGWQWTHLGRFLMNVMLAAGGYPWTVIPVEERDAYMKALEAASSTEDIAPFTDFLATLVSANLEGKPGPTVP
ncbi:hypothetical protein [Thiogranum longum]|uniref:hypothetical protein n=1 Tax=Thiogranum longum TaxID=1537524 RepID=UPI001FB29027|nr:hypothetical protein [Thiogranum longum]